jgi:hypothetical protein
VGAITNSHRKIRDLCRSGWGTWIRTAGSTTRLIRSDVAIAFVEGAPGGWAKQVQWRCAAIRALAITNKQRASLAEADVRNSLRRSEGTGRGLFSSDLHLPPGEFRSRRRSIRILSPPGVSVCSRWPNCPHVFVALLPSLRLVGWGAWNRVTRIVRV